MTNAAAPSRQPTPRFESGVVARICLAGIALAFACLAGTGGRQAIDHHIDVRTFSLMRHGSGYYAAMNRAMREVGHAPVDEVRAFRMPTVFLIWRWLPNTQAIWLLFVAMVVVTALITFRITRFQFVAPVLALLLLTTGKMLSGSQWLNQFAVVELWAAPASVATLLAWKRERKASAAWFALLAFAIRELAAGMLVFGLIASLRHRRARLHWIGACTVAAVFYLVHSHEAMKYLVAHGTGVQLPLFGTGGPSSVAAMMGFAIPVGIVVGPLLWSAAVVRCWRIGHDAALGLLALPLTGFAVDRPYWGLVSLPAVAIFGTEGVAELWRTVVRRGRRDSRDSEPSVLALDGAGYRLR